MEFLKTIKDLNFDHFFSNGTLIVLGVFFIFAFIIYFFIGFYLSKKEQNQV